MRFNDGPLGLGWTHSFDIRADAAAFNSGDTVTVTVTATDNVSLVSAPVIVKLDLDGDGTLAAGESVLGIPTGNPNEFEAVFGALSGPDGPRSIDARATDTSFHVGQDIIPITVPEPGLVAVLLVGVASLVMMRKR